jgi:hypothetical protein
MRAKANAKGGTNRKAWRALGAGDNKKARKRGARITRYALTVEAAGAMAGMSKSAAYRAVKSGLIPVLGEGRNRIVPRLIWEEKLGIKPAAEITPETIKTNEAIKEIA